MPKEDLEFLVGLDFDDKNVFNNPYYLIVKGCLEIHGDEAKIDKWGVGKCDTPYHLLGKKENFISFVSYEAGGLKINSQLYSNGDSNKLMIRARSNYSHRELYTFISDFKKKFNRESKKGFKS